MKKLSLKVDELQVESFTTVPSSARRGTVRGHSDLCETNYGGCSDSTCLQVACGCTAGAGPDAGTCDAGSYCGSCYHNGCESIPLCPTNAGYQGC